MADSCRIELRGVPASLLEVIDRRSGALGMSRSRYLQSLAEADCARAGLWVPEPKQPLSRAPSASVPEPFHRFVRDMSRIGGEMQAACAETLTRFEVAALEALKPVQATDTPTLASTESEDQ